MLKQSDLLYIATIGKTVGLKGDMKLHIKSDFPEQFKKGASFYINEKDKITIENINFERGLVKFEGYNAPELAKKLTNKNLYTTYEQTRKDCHLEEGENFWFDIIGCKVYEENELLGEVQEVERILDTNYLLIQTDKKLLEEKKAKSFLVPHKKPFLLSIDINEKIIKLDGAKDILEAS
ncbi:MAG: ribosome maturation factor RimM [Thiovulaceae bacterium]|nr:ribosome maturation factor RimM [Sulfurimonadaceae bacterium]MCW9026702.1 ribosome maturation factor RimM [Sulfurimonadaceae bacterium]